MTYNGSANWETHNIGEKFQNPLYDRMMEALMDEEVVDAIDEEWVKELVEQSWVDFDPAHDVDRDDLRLVDWSELVEDFQEEWNEIFAELYEETK